MIPRKILCELDFERLENHFLDDIIGESRRTRFGAGVSDEYIKQYLNKTKEKIGKTDMWFVVDIGDRIIAACHVSYDKKTNTSELGLTVSPDYRNQKIGQELFNRGVTWSRMKGAETIFMHCLTENLAIQHIARKGGMTVVTVDMGEKEGTIKVNKNTLVSTFEDAIMENMAIYDSTIRNQQWFFKNFMKMFGRK